MTALSELASVIKSANAGASMLTLDIGFPTAEVFRSVLDSDVLNAELVASLYRVPPQSVRFFVCEALLALKVTIPRRRPSGGPAETDFDGTQQFIPLLEIEIWPMRPLVSGSPGFPDTDRPLARYAKERT